MFFVLLFSFCFPYVISIGNNIYDQQSFYSKYPLSEWNKATKNQKKSMLEDFIKRESAVIDAKNAGFENEPNYLKRCRFIESQLLVNSFYDKFVAAPLVNKNDLSLSLKHLGKEAFVRHLVITHRESSLPSSNERTKDAAVKKISDLRKTFLSEPSSFSSMVLNYSEDPGASRNEGSLGWLSWGRTPMSFQSIVWDLELGELSSPIETEYGYHLAMVDSFRVSEYAFFDSSTYSYEALRRSLMLIRKELAKVSVEYENSLFSDGGVVIYDDSFKAIYRLINTHKNSVGKNETFNLYDFLSSLEHRFVVCSIDEKLYGLKYFLSSISQFNPSSIPSFSSSDELISFFKTLVLRSCVAERALKKKLNKKMFFMNFFNIEKSKVLYDSYLRHLVNSVSTPDSTEINNYYDEHKNTKYFNPEKVVIRQIRLKNKSVADSLLDNLNQKNFSDIASTFSINRKNTGGLMEAFEKGKYNNMGEEAFLLEVGEISGVIENYDKTFSIIMLESKIEKDYLPLKKVYKRIESLLLKTKQEKIKKDTFDGYLNNTELKIGKDFEIYFN